MHPDTEHPTSAAFMAARGWSTHTVAGLLDTIDSGLWGGWYTL